jgi:DNA-binding NtrC family response regulator
MSPTPSNRTVLVIDDDDSFRTALQELLEQRGLSVRTAGDAFEAKRELQQNTFDAIFTDIRMPGGGFAVLAQAREQGLRVPIIFVTGSPSVEWKARAQAEGAFDYLIKPVGKEQILSVLRRALEKARFAADGRQAETARHVEPIRAGARG